MQCYDVYEEGGIRYSLCGTEGGVEHLLAVQVVDAAHLVQVERVLAGDGAVEPGLQEGGPHLSPVARVALTDTADTGHHALREGHGQRGDKGKQRKGWGRSGRIPS